MDLETTVNRHEACINDLTNKYNKMTIDIALLQDREKNMLSSNERLSNKIDALTVTLSTISERLLTSELRRSFFYNLITTVGNAGKGWVGILAIISTISITLYQFHVEQIAHKIEQDSVSKVQSVMPRAS